MTFSHTSVMLEETVAGLAPRDGGVYIDCTLGGGGHTRHLLESADCTVIGLDRDEDALAAATERLAEFGDRFRPVHAAFSDIADVHERLALPRVNGIMADLGVSSHQLDTDARGFSFRRSGPIDMRMDRSTGQPASVWVNKGSETELIGILKDYGEERFARRIVRIIIEGRPWSDTVVLAKAISMAYPAAKRHGRIHPATKSFQALRIAVNDELGEIRTLLAASIDLLDVEGRISVLSFHSLEDRIVKRFFNSASGKNAERDPYGHPIGPVHLSVFPSQTPAQEEVSGSDGDTPRTANPRARSARLRVAERLPWNAP